MGSNSNVGEKGVEAEINRASVLEIDLSTHRTYLFTSGLRNPNGLSWQPESGALWVVVNERDEIGSDLVPDYMTSVRRGGFCWAGRTAIFGQHVDVRVQSRRDRILSPRPIKPDYALGPHTASLGLAFYTGRPVRSPISEAAPSSVNTAPGTAIRRADTR